MFRSSSTYKINLESMLGLGNFLIPGSLQQEVKKEAKKDQKAKLKRLSIEPSKSLSSDIRKPESRRSASTESDPLRVSEPPSQPFIPVSKGYTVYFYLFI